MKEKKQVSYALFLAFQLGFLIVVPLIGFLFLGIFLDKKFNSSPIFLLLSIFLSFIFLFFEIRHFLLPIIRK
ncbi:AtpZ/AtpI family protein [bacterium]|nr:AtpZ/AtpI family protein [bacterium]